MIRSAAALVALGCAAFALAKCQTAATVKDPAPAAATLPPNPAVPGPGPAAAGQPAAPPPTTALGAPRGDGIHQDPPPPAQGVVDGAVLAANGKPVDGAVVAVNPLGASPLAREIRPIDLQRTGPDGKFHFQVPPQRVALAACAPGFAGALALNLEVAPGTSVHHDLTLGEAGVTYTGKLRSAIGAPLDKLLFRIARNSQDEGDVFFPEVAPDGSFSFTADPTWTFTVYVDAAEHERAFASLGPKNVGKPLEISVPERMHDELAPPAEVTAFIKEHALPLTTVEAGHDFNDLRALGRVIGEARIVSVGEATHGTREFFQLKHRLLEYLVAEKGFTVFAIEASWPDALLAEEYVLHGKGSAARAVSNMRFWTWNTEEVVALVEWMRKWNQEPKHKAKVHFQGFDMQSPPSSARMLLAFLAKVDPKVAAHAEVELVPLAGELTYPEFGRLPAPRRARATAELGSLARQFAARQKQWSAKAGAVATLEARQALEVLTQGARLFSSDISPAERDVDMAENVHWLVDTRFPKAKAMLWAHNGHVNVNPDGIGEVMGSELRKRYGAAMETIGFSFNQGSFQAMELPFPSKTGLREFTVKPAAPGSLDGTFASTGLPLFAFDLHAAPKDGAVGAWFAKKHGSRSIGAGFGDQFAEGSGFIARIQPGETFDAMLFVEKTSAAHAMPSGKRPVENPPPLAAPQNLDFAQGAPGKAPEGWLVPLGSRTSGYSATLVEGKPCGGGRCAMLAHDEASSVAPGPGLLGQTLEATPLRGKLVRLRARVRTEPIAPGDRARLYLRTFRPAQQPGLFEVTLDETGGRNWVDVEVSGTIEADAERVSFGLSLEGPGKAFLGPATLEVTTPKASAQAQ